MCLLNGYVSKTPDNPVAPKILDLLRMFEPNKHYKVSKVLKQLRPVVEKFKFEINSKHTIYYNKYINKKDVCFEIFIPSEPEIQKSFLLFLLKNNEDPDFKKISFFYYYGIDPDLDQEKKDIGSVSINLYNLLKSQIEHFYYNVSFEHIDNATRFEAFNNEVIEKLYSFYPDFLDKKSIFQKVSDLSFESCEAYETSLYYEDLEDFLYKTKIELYRKLIFFNKL